jgi:hypothetical protein
VSRKEFLGIPVGEPHHEWSKGDRILVHYTGYNEEGVVLEPTDHGGWVLVEFTTEHGDTYETPALALYCEPIP